ncbi:type II toxin-antitoxin system ParD family antitoxin [Pannonibacter sp. Q-1]|uniref:CopG family transcriptional regulator n=1 Tax=Pannonibacter phragmitetus TaxID=121719 RepID=A0A0U3PT80_9HYPH|nr:type II toxin-antitoxin system ParD family antitoxin [Pannonibacter phragmitetus]ALV30525.1 CopG family transcriptional regulator [Pannonibacter phragmitetus]
MQNAEKISVTMTPEMMQVIRASVASGEYASTSEALRDAVRIWQRERQEHAERMAAIRQRVKASADDPRPSVSADEVMTRLQALHAETVKGHDGEGR